MQRSARLIAPLLLVAAGCGDFAGSAPGGQFGASQGGAQDMGLARELIAEGKIPPAEAFVVEGMFSEHDLPLTGDRCERTLCLRGALGVTPAMEGPDVGWMQIGMSSTIDPDNYQRPTATIIATVDVSGSMGWSYDTEDDRATPAELAVSLLTKIATELDARDRLAIVTYGSKVKVLLEPTRGSEQTTILKAIAELGSGGSTNMEAGLEKAYELAAEDDVSEEVRVMLFTDARPNVGATDSSDFSAMAAAAAEGGVGTTVFGLGLGLGQEVFESMSTLRGGNAFSLFQNEHVSALMDDSWPWMVAPIAYDFSLETFARTGTLVETFGFPGEGKLEAASIFLSRRRGAMLLKFNGFSDGYLSVRGDLSYTTRDGELVTESLSADFTKSEAQSFEQSSVQKTVALALLVTGMRQAVVEFVGDGEAALATMDATIERVSADQDVLADDGLAGELELAKSLRTIMDEQLNGPGLD